MFDNIKGMFETYSRSNASSKDVTLRPVEVKMGPDRAMELVINLLQDLKYKKITYNDTYYEAFTSKAGYEVTIRALRGGQGNTSVEVEVYAPNHRGKTRKALRYLLNAINEKINKNGVF